LLLTDNKRDDKYFMTLTAYCGPCELCELFNSRKYELLEGGVLLPDEGIAIGQDASVVAGMNGKDVEKILNGSSMDGVLNRAAIYEKPNAPGGQSLTWEWKASGALSPTADHYASDASDEEGMYKLLGAKPLLLDDGCCLVKPKILSKRRNDETELAFTALPTRGTHTKPLALHMYQCRELRGGELALFDSSCGSPSPRLLGACELEQVEWDSGALSTRYSQEGFYADLSNGEIELTREELILGDRAGCEQLLYGVKDGHNFKTVKASNLPSTGDVYDETFVDLGNNDGDLLGDRLALLDDKDCRSAVRIILVYEGEHQEKFNCVMNNDNYDGARLDHLNVFLKKHCRRPDATVT
jgi:hypothetical protein